MTKTNKWHRSKKMLLYAFVFQCLVILACASPIKLFKGGGSSDQRETENWQITVDKIRILTRGQSIPQHLIDPEKPATDQVFDPNLLLEPLNHLSLQPGYTLGFVYDYDGMGGRPILYAREESAVPNDGHEADQDTPSGEDYLQFIQADGTEEGYFHWVLLRMMGDQFYLYWHAGYNDVEIIASKARLGEVVDELTSTEFGEPLSSSQKRQALRIDPAPVVEITEDLVMVRVVWFTKWGGFYEMVTTLTASVPYQVIDTQSQQLIPYDCQVMF
ncbi:MAG: hypothetical protein U9R53_08635 [Chloroflexota bacterium]|nr:hypothetical protein [Chloroflexota bacterium]